MMLPTEIWDIAPWYSGLPSGESCKRLALALQIYIDDSGKNDPPVFVLAGFLASAENWVAFSNEWRACLAREPSLEYLKMADANSRNGTFRGVAKDARDLKIRELALIAKDHVEFGISVAIPHAAYDAVFRGKWMKVFDTPYALAFYLIIAATHKYLAAAGNHEEVDLIFDRQLDQEKLLNGAHSFVTDGLPQEVLNRFPTPPVFMDDKRAIPIQAADMLAWHIRRSWKEGRDKLPKLSTAGEILNEMLLINEIWLQRDLERMFGLGAAKMASMNTLPPHQATAVNESFELMATAANIEVMEVAVPFTPIEMVSFPAIGMEKYLLVRSCAACGSSHLHKRLDNRCLAEQTAVDWGFEPS